MAYAVLLSEQAKEFPLSIFAISLLKRHLILN